MTIHQRLSGVTFSHKLSSSEFLAFADAGVFKQFRRIELIEGELWTVNAVHRWHARAQIKFGFAIEEGLRAAGLDLVIYGAGSVLMSDDSVPEPDFSICDEEPLIRAPISLEATRIAVELSDGSRDMDLKRKAALYARSGVAEYWVADRETQTLVRHSDVSETGYRAVDSFAFGEAVSSATLPGLQVETTSLLD